MIRFTTPINLVGIEFEGLWQDDFARELIGGHDDLIRDGHHDGSLEFGRVRNDQAVIEIVTQPLNESKLNRVMEMIIDASNKKLYQINSSCGLHFHVSLNKGYYYYLICPEFFTAYSEMMQSKFGRVYRNRWDNHYCSYHVDANYFHPDADRYHAVNYCYTKHGTIEFRAYGGEYATLPGLADCINETIHLIGKFCTEKGRHHQEKIQPIELEVEDGLPEVKVIEGGAVDAPFTKIVRPTIDNFPSFSNPDTLNRGQYATYTTSYGTITHGGGGGGIWAEQSFQDTVEVMPNESATPATVTTSNDETWQTYNDLVGYGGTR